MSRDVRVLGVGPVHPGRGEPSRIVLHVHLAYLKGEPIESVVISPEQAVRLIEQLAQALRVTAAGALREGGTE